MFSDFKSSFPQVTIFSLSQIPIRPINFTDPADKTRHDKLVSLVERMLALHKSLAYPTRMISTHNPQEADRLTREVEAVDKSIDGLAASHELSHKGIIYGLSEDEVKVVEGRGQQ